MARYLAKHMAAGEWPPFRAAYQQLFMASGADRKLALFIEQHDPDKVEPLVLIPDYLSEVIQRLAPGGWRDMPDAPERNWTLLVGNKSALGDFGLNIGG